MNKSIKKFLSLTFVTLLILIQSGVLAIANSGVEATINDSDSMAGVNDSDVITQIDEIEEQVFASSNANETITSFAKLAPDVEVQIITAGDDKSLLSFLMCLMLRLIVYGQQLMKLLGIAVTLIMKT